MDWVDRSREFAKKMQEEKVYVSMDLSNRPTVVA